jgi:hypothetical protein
MRCPSPVSFVLFAYVAFGCTSNRGGADGAAGTGGAVTTGGAGGGAIASGGAGGTGGTGVDAAAPVGLTISGPVDSQVQGEGRQVVLLWEVSSGSPDYFYKFGESLVTKGRFSITLPTEPPAEAINSFGIGIAIVVVLPAGTTLADGKLVASTFKTEMLAGVSSRYGVIWRAKTLELPSKVSPDFWGVSFPVGYACGACTPKPDGGSSFEGFAPTACDHVELTTYAMADMCNWT